MSVLSETYDGVDDLYIEICNRISRTYDRLYVKVPYEIHCADGYIKKESYDCYAGRKLNGWGKSTIDDMVVQAMCCINYTVTLLNEYYHKTVTKIVIL